MCQIDTRLLLRFYHRFHLVLNNSIAIKSLASNRLRSFDILLPSDFVTDFATSYPVYLLTFIEFYLFSFKLKEKELECFNFEFKPVDSFSTYRISSSRISYLNLELFIHAQLLVFLVMKFCVANGLINSGFQSILDNPLLNLQTRKKLPLDHVANTVFKFTNFLFLNKNNQFTNSIS